MFSPKISTLFDSNKQISAKNKLNFFGDFRKPVLFYTKALPVRVFFIQSFVN